MTKHGMVAMDIVGSRVPAKPSRFEHYGARGDFLPTDLRPSSLRSRGRTQRTRNTKTQDLYWFGPPLWCNTLLQCGDGGLPLGLNDEQYKGKNSLLRLRCSCAWCACVGGIILDLLSTCDGVDPPFLLWWLVLLI